MNKVTVFAIGLSAILFIPTSFAYSDYGYTTTDAYGNYQQSGSC